MILREHIVQVFDPPAPGSDRWWSLITPSKIPAILGLSPWQSRRECFDRMLAARTAVADADPDRRPRHVPAGEPLSEKPAEWVWGHCAELSLAEHWLALCGGRHSRLSAMLRRSDGTHTGEIAFRHTRLPFPNLATLDRLDWEGATDPGRILECKTDYRGTDVIPASWQVAGQMLITGIPRASLITLGHPSGLPTITDLVEDPERTTWLHGALTAWNRALISGALPDDTSPLTPPYAVGCRAVDTYTDPKEAQ